MTPLLRLLAYSLFTTSAAHAFTEAELKSAAAQFPPMPRGTVDMFPFVGSFPTFSSGSPFNDLGYTLYDTDYIDGENSGFDTFMPVDPGDAFPGANRVKYVRCALNTDLDKNYAAAAGDRIILGTAEIPVPFFSRGPDGIDNDYAVIQHFDFAHGHIQLRGSAADYQLLYATTADGVATEGWYLFFVNAALPDLIAFIFPCNEIEPAISGNPPQNATPYDDAGTTLSLTNATQFRFAQPLPTTPVLNGGIAQFGSAGKEIVLGMGVDDEGCSYLVGCTDGNLDGATDAPNEIFVARISPTGETLWVREMAMSEGTALKSAVADSEHVYVAGRTLGALPGFTNAGRWDGILLKLRRSDGVIVAMDQWGNAGIDGYGNIILDNAGHLYVSAQGSPPGPATNDDAYLVAKHRTSDLGNVWRMIDSVVATGFKASAEAWAGLTFVPSALPTAPAGEGRLIVAGWYMANNGANAFASVYDDLSAVTPTRSATTVLATTGTRAEWFFDSAVDALGRIYFVGYTTGVLPGQTALGEGDAFLARYSSSLTSPVFRQFGTSRSDMASALEMDADGNLHVLGYTYGTLAETNADPAGMTGDVFVRTFDSSLNPVRTRQFGTVGEDRGFMKLKGDNLIIGGMTEAALCGPNHGSFDGFLLALDRHSLQISTTMPPAVALSLKPVANAPALDLQWPVQPGKMYQLQQSATLSGWQNVGAPQQPIFGQRWMQKTLPNALNGSVPHTFYRVSESTP
jgi:hypothetical protein